jgi:acetyl-CoA carboxylase biotin carboxyl carrier protein
MRLLYDLQLYRVSVINKALIMEFLVVTTSKIEKLILLMQKHDLSELHVQYDANSSVTVKTKAPSFASDMPNGMTCYPTQVAEQVQVRSPMVGTVYLSPKPGEQPYVKPGQKVRKGDTLCLVEAMKMFNKIQADRDGIIAKVLVKDTNNVDYDQPLFVWQDSV